MIEPIVIDEDNSRIERQRQEDQRKSEQRRQEIFDKAISKLEKDFKELMEAIRKL